MINIDDIIKEEWTQFKTQYNYANKEPIYIFQLEDFKMKGCQIVLSDNGRTINQLELANYKLTPNRIIIIQEILNHFNAKLENNVIKTYIPISFNDRDFLRGTNDMINQYCKRIDNIQEDFIHALLTIDSIPLLINACEKLVESDPEHMFWI